MQTIEEEHLNTVKALLAALAQGDWTAVRENLTEDVTFHFPGDNALSGDYRGREVAIDLLARVTEWTGGTTRVRLHDVLANEQHAVLLYTVSAKHNDNAVTYRYIDVYHFREGKVSEVWGSPVDIITFNNFYSE